MDPMYLYAKWTPNIYIVRFDANAGSPAPASQNIAYGERAEEPPLMILTGKAFEGWYTDTACTILWSFDTPVVSSVTLYAKWADAVYTVTFNLRAGTPGDPPKDQQVIYEGMAIEPFMPPLPAGDVSSYSFYRWDYSTDGSGNISTLQPYDFSTQVTSNLTLYARWTLPDPDMIWVPKGSFIMGDSGVSGSPAAYHAYPTRRVTLDGFFISRFEITQIVTPDTNKSYQEVTGYAPSQFSANTGRPVDRVSWYDAVNYCIKLTSQTPGLTQVYTMTNVTQSTTALSGTNPKVYPIISANVSADFTKNGYRLPTEAEWEYAARGGNSSPGGFIYAGSNNPDAVAWYNITVQAQPAGLQATQTVGSKAPNSLGLYDMSGNVSEWCWDWFDTYSNIIKAPGNDNNFTGPATGTEKVRRGGGWSNAAGNVRSVARNSDTPGTATWVIGFRVVRGPSVIW